MASIKDVAERAGVSVTTVSLVLNNKGNIRPETRDRVLQAVEELSYTRNIRARNLRERQSRIIGYAQMKERDEFNPLLDRFLFKLAQMIEEADYHILLFNTSKMDLVASYHELIQNQRVDGFVLSFTEQNDPRFRYLYERDFPFVAFGRSVTEMDEVTHWVDVDGRYGIYQATQHLIEQGHRLIAFLGWPEGSASGDLRYHGYEDALHDYNLPFNPDLVRRTENYISNGYACAKQLLAVTPAPTAVVIVSDALAIGVLQYFNQTHASIAVTGFDDTPTAEYMHPALTSVRQPITQVARILTDMLLDQLSGHKVATKQHVLKPELIIRESSRPIVTK